MCVCKPAFLIVQQSPVNSGHEGGRWTHSIRGVSTRSRRPGFARSCGSGRGVINRTAQQAEESPPLQGQRDEPITPREIQVQASCPQAGSHVLEPSFQEDPFGDPFLTSERLQGSQTAGTLVGGEDPARSFARHGCPHVPSSPPGLPQRPLSLVPVPGHPPPPRSTPPIPPHLQYVRAGCGGRLWPLVPSSPGTPSHCPAPPHPQPQKPHPRTGGSRARQPLLELILQAREGRIRWGLGEGRASGSPDFMGPQREGSGSQWVRTGIRPCPRFAQDPPSVDRVSPPSWGPLGPEMLGALRTGPGGWTGRSC